MASTPETLEVIYEDNHILAVNKKSGDILQADKTGDTPLSEVAKEYLKKKYDKPGNVFCGITHRLDRPTTGAVLLAKTSKALSRLNDMFRENQVKKTYWAITQKADIPETATLHHWLIKNPETNRSKAYSHPVERGKEAILHYRKLTESDNYMLLEVRIDTGRHHQIRAQLATMGLSIKGDLKYGAPRSNGDGSISLHAREIRFTHPVSHEQIVITAPTPEETLWTALTSRL